MKSFNYFCQYLKNRREKILLLLLFLLLNVLLVYGFNVTINRKLLRKHEIKLLKLLNLERTARGYKPLKEHPVLRKIARNHTRQMITQNQLNHKFPGYKSLKQRIKEQGLIFKTAAENIAYCDTFIAIFIHKALMNSKPHKNNILDINFTHCGISMIMENERFYVTQDFAQLSK